MLNILGCLLVHISAVKKSECIDFVSSLCGKIVFRESCSCFDFSAPFGGSVFFIERKIELLRAGEYY